MKIKKIERKKMSEETIAKKTFDEELTELESIPNRNFAAEERIS